MNNGLNINKNEIKLLIKRYGAVHIHQNKNAAPRLNKNFCTIFIVFVLVKFSGPRRKEAIKTVPIVNMNCESRKRKKNEMIITLITAVGYPIKHPIQKRYFPILIE
jgi:hypothetical protein